MENNIKISNDKVEVVFLPLWAGCMVFLSGLMTVAGLFILFYIVPSTSILRGFFGIVIGIIGTFFFGSIFLKILSVVMNGKALFTIENGQLKGRKQAIPIREIKDIYWGGASLKYIMVQTINNKKVKLSTYNLVSEQPVNHVIETYVLPDANPELKNNWAKRKK
ncbi:DUF5381 family protein [Ferdinandcohnia sp. Marseille-Q9671]